MAVVVEVVELDLIVVVSEAVAETVGVCHSGLVSVAETVAIAVALGVSMVVIVMVLMQVGVAAAVVVVVVLVLEAVVEAVDCWS